MEAWRFEPVRSKGLPPGVYLPGALFFLLMVLLVAPNFCTKDPFDQDAWLKGSVRANHPRLGSWNYRPVSCVSGREAGFRGVVFRFADASEVRELRVHAGAPGKRWVELYLANGNPSPARIDERECQKLDGALRLQEVQDGDHSVDHVSGLDEISCLADGLVVSLNYNGCRPEF